MGRSKKGREGGRVGGKGWEGGTVGGSVKGIK